MELNKSDLPALTFIIDKLLENDFPIYSDDLTKNGLISGDSHIEIESKFENLLAIIKLYGCALVTDARNEDHGASVEKNGFTSKFKKDGGFNNAFNNLQREMVHKDMIEYKEQLGTKIAELTEINLIMQNKQLRTKMLFSIIGFILGIIATNWKEILTVLKIISPPEMK